MNSKSTGGKGDARRRENNKKFRQNYAEIFKKFRTKPKKTKKQK